LSAEMLNKLYEKGTDYLLESPALLGLAAICLLSGHLLFFMIFTYITDKDATKTYLNTKIGKMALGALLYGFVGLPLYIYQHQSIAIEYDKLISITPAAIIVGLSLQAIFFIIFIYRSNGSAQV